MTNDILLQSILDGIVEQLGDSSIVSIIYPECKKHNLNPFEEVEKIIHLCETAPGQGSEKFDYAYEIWLKNLEG